MRFAWLRENKPNYFVFHLLNGGSLATAFSPDQLNALVTLFLGAHSIGFTPQGAYFMHVFTDSKFLVRLRIVVQKVKKMGE